MLVNKWIISDTHFNHAKLVEYEHRPIDFNEIIKRNWRKRVKPTDIVIHTGDVILGHDSELGLILKDLPGKKILCRGNHDHHSDAWYMERGFDFVTDYFILDDIAFSHAPLTPLPLQIYRQNNREPIFIPKPVRLNVHGHFHRGLHRGQPGMPDSYFDHKYFDANRDKYRLVQIEDNLSPVLLSSII